MTYRAVLFDLDGTLLDTLDDLADSMNLALASLGLPGHPTPAYKMFVGDGMDTLARRVVPAGTDHATTAACLQAMRREYSSRWADKTRPYDGIPELLDELTRRAVPMAVLSNKPDDFTRLVVQRLLGKWPFAAVAGVLPDGPKKPDPAGAVAIARDLGIVAKEFCYVGDTNTDMRTARAAGMYAVGATWGFRSAEELLENGAQKLIQHPLELLALL